MLSSIIICEFLDDFSNVLLCTIWQGGRCLKFGEKGKILDLGVVEN